MTELNSAQLRRSELESLSEWAKEEGVDHKSLIKLAKEIAMACMDEGIISEKVCMKTDTGAVEVTERFPAIAVSALSFIHKVLQEAQKEIDKLPPPDPIINIIVSRKRLEETLAEGD